MGMRMGMMQEKREYPRMDFNRLVRLESDAHNTMQLIGINYSQTGLALQSKEPLFVGELVELFFRLDDEETTDHQLHGEVVHNFREGDVFTSGIRFIGHLEIPELLN